MQATPGKMLFKLIVTTEQQDPISLRRSLLRSGARVAMVAPLLIGFPLAMLFSRTLQLPNLAARTMLCAVVLTIVIGLIHHPLAAFTAKQQALHDLIARTLVVRREEMEFPESALKGMAAVILFAIVRTLVPPQ